MRLKIIHSKSQPPTQDFQEEPRYFDNDSVLISSLLKSGKKLSRFKITLNPREPSSLHSQNQSKNSKQQNQFPAKPLKLKCKLEAKRKPFPAKTKRRRKQKQKKKIKLDEPSRLQRRSRYFLIKIKLEQNLIDAYSAEGWKGKSREKIKPENELLRARKQISKCKLALRDVVRQLDSLSSLVSIDESLIHSDGSVSHEHIFCAKCKMNEVSAHNDIVLCGGICNRSFHQNCLDPPLTSENIPPGNQGWVCNFCESRIEIIEAINAHLGTRFAVNIKWEKIFKDEAMNTDNGQILTGENWPSDDPSDEDFDPHRPASCSTSSCDGLTTSSSEEKILLGRRARKDVDYKKLYNDMFGKNEKVSEDEDWRPAKKRRKEKETDAASTLVHLPTSDQLLAKSTFVLGGEKRGECTDEVRGIENWFKGELGENDLERLWVLKYKVEELRKKILTGFPSTNGKMVQERVVFVPVAELKEKHLPS